MRESCTHCRAPMTDGYHPFCPRCGEMVGVDYDLDRVRLVDSDNPYERFGQLLPVKDASLLPDDSRYTPCVHAEGLGEALGLPHLFLKDETVLPTRTTKDRMADVGLAFLFEHGVRNFGTSSTGNSSTSLAHAIRRFPDMRLCVFTASDFADRLHIDSADQVASFILRDATFVEAFEYAAIFSRRHGLVAERGFFNPGRREGLKIAFLEAADQVPQTIDWYVQAVSSAMGVFGTYKAASQLHQLGRIDRLPRLLCVQQDSCAPMVNAFEAGSDVIRPQDIVAHPHGIAKAILRGDPTRAYPHIKRIVDETGGHFAAVSQQQIREARRMVEELEGISPCFSASTAVAGLIQQVEAGRVPTDQTVLINLTGGDRPAEPPDPSACWLSRTADGWEAEDPDHPQLRALGQELVTEDDHDLLPR